MGFEDEKVLVILDGLVEKDVMRKEGEHYHINEDFDLIFRGRLIRKLRHHQDKTEALMDSIVETLDEYKALSDDAVSFDNSLIVRTVLTFAPDDKLMLILSSEKRSE